jgi:hypothetical protein
VLARRDEHEEAARLATEAVEIAERGEAPMLIGDALMDLAEVSLWGAADQVPGFVERAMSCFQRKGAVVPAERARSWLRTAQR